ncbi:MAG: hypothetical protein ABSG43_11375 [Solirubrobacteraceae bacterium]|jgi:hypothetical protein
MRPLTLTLIALLCGLVAAGCAIHDPDRKLATLTPHTTTTTTTVTTTTASSSAGAPDDDEHDGPPIPPARRLPAGAAAITPQAALTRFANLYVNWTAGQLPQRASQLAALSVSQAHAQALGLAARAAALERYQVTNQGTVVAITPGQGQEQGRWAIVTDEVTSGAGPYLGLPAVSHVTWATVAHQPHGYVITSWYPAS